MTQDEFLKEYHNYAVNTYREAVIERATVNLEGIDGDEAIVVQLLGKYCLMLKTAHDHAVKSGIL